MADRRDQLMEPVIEKLGGVLHDLAQKENYDFILNSVDGSGTSIVLYGRQDRDITKHVLDVMGIQVPTKGTGDAGPGGPTGP